jgi:SOS regulatory protein LexA
MELSKVQNRYINSKNTEFSLIKGGSGTGKTTSLIFRLINLENNYCIYEDDKILFLTNNIGELSSVKELYSEYNSKKQIYSLFSLDKNRIAFNTIEQLIDDYYNFYKLQKGLNLKLINKTEALTLLVNSTFKCQLHEIQKRARSIKNMSLDEIYDEILWIKACVFSKEQYSSTARNGRRRINRKSVTRDCIYSLFEIYNHNLRVNGYIDNYDKVLLAIEYVKNSKNKFSHLIVDDIQYLTKLEFQFVKSLYNNSSYSSINFALNNKVTCDRNAWFVRDRKLKIISDEFKSKSYLLEKDFNAFIEKDKNFMDKYQYIDFKHKNISDFNIDTSLSSKEIHLEGGISFVQDEILEVPVFNDIAAGNPIEINESIEDNFYLPKVWLEMGKDIFILHVKGDSMIGKNICDGDLVVIKKQQIAYHNDIVAASIEGEATLKTLNFNGNSPSLVAANERYAAFSLEDKEVSILGVVLGVIKQKK